MFFIESVPTRYPLPDMSLNEEASQSEIANNLRDKFFALKKIFIKKNLTVSTFFTDVRQFQSICRQSLNFEFIGSFIDSITIE